MDGNTDKDIREEYKKKMEAGAQVVIVASYGTFSTGISINKIHNIFFTESFKSEVIIRQSIGRGLRIGDSKKEATLFDIADDFRIGKHVNFTLNHFGERLKIYDEEKFKYKMYNIKVNNE